MAENEEIVNGDEESQDKKQQKKASKHDSGAVELERVTDYAEEKEIFSDISNAANMFTDKRKKEDEEKLAKERELQKIHVKKEDVELIMNEMEISRLLAEKTLREHFGNVVSALEALTN